MSFKVHKELVLLYCDGELTGFRFIIPELKGYDSQMYWCQLMFHESLAEAIRITLLRTVQQFLYLTATILQGTI